MGEIDELINQQVEDELRELDDAPKGKRPYDARVVADARAIANLASLPRPLKPPGRS